VPWKSVHAYHFSNMKARTQVAVVHEIWFRSHKEKVGVGGVGVVGVGVVLLLLLLNQYYYYYY
jgi:hypothetical protein